MFCKKGLWDLKLVVTSLIIWFRAKRRDKKSAGKIVKIFWKNFKRAISWKHISEKKPFVFSWGETELFIYEKKHVRTVRRTFLWVEHLLNYQVLPSTSTDAARRNDVGAMNGLETRSSSDEWMDEVESLWSGRCHSKQLEPKNHHKHLRHFRRSGIRECWVLVRMIVWWKVELLGACFWIIGASWLFFNFESHHATEGNPESNIKHEIGT